MIWRSVLYHARSSSSCAKQPGMSPHAPHTLTCTPAGMRWKIAPSAASGSGCRWQFAMPKSAQ